MKDYEIAIKDFFKNIQEDESKEIEEILKKLQEYTDRSKNNFSYYSINEYEPNANNYLTSTQAFNPEYEAR